MSDEQSQISHEDLIGVPGKASASAATPVVNESDSSNRFLAPPNRLVRQQSNESLFSGSDISELSFGSLNNRNGYSESLTQTLSNVSSTVAHVPNPSTWKSIFQQFWFANYGAFLVLISQMFGCTMNIATRLLETPGSHGEAMHPFQILFVRQSVTTLITTIYALWSKSIPHFPLGPPGVVRLLLVLRGFFGFLGVFGLYFSLIYLPLSEAIVLTFLGTIGTCYAFSILLPGETFSRQQQLAGFVSLVGVVFIAKPASIFHSDATGGVTPHEATGSNGNATSSSSDTSGPSEPTPAQHLQAVGIAMIGVVGGIVALTAIRAVGQRAHALLSVNYFSSLCTIVSLAALVVIPSVKFRLPQNLLEWGLLTILGSCGFVMQLLLTLGLAYGSAAGSGTTLSSGSEDDVELQSRAVEPQANAPITSTPVVSHAQNHKREGSAGIKGSGAKATSMIYTQMLFALIADKVVFGVTPSVWSWIGSGLILTGAVWVAADSAQKATPVESSSATVGRRRSSTRKATGNVEQEEVGLLADMDEGNAESAEEPRLAPYATQSSSQAGNSSAGTFRNRDAPTDAEANDISVETTGLESTGTISAR